MRKATEADRDAILDTLSRAFAEDPVWGGWAFPDRARAMRQRSAVFGLWVDMTLRYGWVKVTEGCEAVASWFPPGTGEDTPEDYDRLVRLAHEQLGDHARIFLDGCAIIESSRPLAEPHYYLSLLATHDAHRGRGLAASLLDESLALIDRERMPAYLDSTNPKNLPLYERRGFRIIGSYQLPEGPAVDQMWRAAARKP